MIPFIHSWKKHLRAYFLFFLLLASVSGCTNNPKQEVFTIAFSQCIGSDAWREAMLSEMKRELSFHSNIRFIYKDAGGDNETQIKQINEILKQEIDLLIVSPNESDPLTPVVDKAFQKGIPIIVTDRKTSSGLYNAYVGANNYDIGHLAGLYLAKKLNGNGTIAEITGLPGSSPSIERQQGFHFALSDFPKMKIEQQLNGQWLIDESKKEILKHASKLKQVDAIFAFNDQMALGASIALERLLPQHTIKIVGVDAMPGKNNGMDQVANGVFDASMLYPTGGKESIRTALAILNKQPYQRENILQTLVIDSSNVQIMKLQADKIDSQQQDVDRQLALLSEQKAIYRSQQTILNILIISLVLAIIFGGITFFLLKANWEKNKKLEVQNKAIMEQKQKLIDLNNKVKDATEAKINFFTNISHEFKTPLTLILSPVEELISDPSLSFHVRDQLTLVRKNSLRLMKLVNQLIDLRRVGYERLKLQSSEQNIVAFINQILFSFKPLASLKNIAIHLKSNTNHTNVWFDSNLMEKVFYNLLSNAFKFTNEHGIIIIKIDSNTHTDHLTINIEDSGRGIKKAHLSHIFDPFYQGEYSADGSGIGLALVKDVINLHYGTVEVKSKEGEGSIFIINLPYGEKHLDEHEKTNNYSESSIGLFDQDRYMVDQEADTISNSLPSSPIQEYSVLIVDDHPDILRFLSDKLRMSYTILTAQNVDDALEITYNKMPDIILSDLIMPGKSGIDFLKIIKNDSRSSHIPLVLITAHENITQKTQGIEALADMYITKPFNIQHIKAVIQNLITNRQNLQTKYTSQTEDFQYSQKSEITNVDRRFLNDLSATVENNLSNCSFTVEDVCTSIGISRIQLYRKVKVLLNTSVNDYIIERRLKQAKYLLQQDKVIYEVANETGFASSTYFSTAFKKRYGISPSAFKDKIIERRTKVI